MAFGAIRGLGSSPSSNAEVARAGGCGRLFEFLGGLGLGFRIWCFVLWGGQKGDRVDICEVEADTLEVIIGA